MLFDLLYLNLFWKSFKLFKHLKCMKIFHIGHFWNFDSFPSCQILKTKKLAYFPNWKFLKFFQLENYEIFLIKNWQISKISPFAKLTIFQTFRFRKLSKFQNLMNFEIIRPFDIPHQSQFCLFSYLLFDIN